MGCSAVRSYDQQGFLVTGIAACTTGIGQGGLGANAAGAIGGKIRSTNEAANYLKPLPTVLRIVAVVGGLWI